MKHALLALLFAASTACAQIKISELPAASTLTGTEATMVTQGGVSKKATVTQINAYTLTSTGTLTGKTISGADNTLSNVAFSALTALPTTLAGYGITDGLLAATAASTYATITNLNLKAPIASPTFTGTVTIPSGASISGYLTTATAASTYAPLVAANMTDATINGLSLGQGGGGLLILNAASSTSLEVASGLNLNISAPFGTAAFKDYGGDELQLLIWGTNANTDPPASILTATALGALKRNVTQLPINLGGTNATTRAGGLNNLLPDQTGAAGRVLLTDGTNVAFGLVELGIGTVGLLPISALDNGTNADATTFWRGDGTWAAPDLTALNASNLSSGTVPTARLGSGTANSTTYLRGDQTWQTISSGITIGTTTSNGTAGRVLYTDGTNVQAYAVTGSGSAVLGTSPTITGLAPSAVTGTAAILGANTFTGQQVISVNAAASTPPIALTGTVFTGGSATTTKPQLLIEPTGTTSTGWTTLGTAYGANMPTGFQGRFFDGLINGSSKTYLEADNNGKTTLALNSFIFQGDFGGSNRMRMGGSSGGFYFEPGQYMALGAGTYLGWCAVASGPGNSGPDLLLHRDSAATLQLGADVTSGSAIDQTFKAADGLTGTNAIGGDLNLKSGDTTGTGTSDVVIFTPAAGASGTTARTAAERVRINSTAMTMTAGLPLAVASGTNQRAGDATLASGTVTVSNTTVTAKTRVFITRKTSGGTLGMALTYTLSAGTSFTISSDNVLDTSVVSYFLVEVP